LTSTAKILGEIKLSSFNTELRNLMNTNKSYEVRSSALQALGNLNYEGMEEVMAQGMKDKSTEVRVAAVDMLSNIEISAEDLPDIIRPIFQKGSHREQQTMLGVLAEMPIAKSESVLNALIDQAANNKISPNVILDLMEAIETTESEMLIAQLDKLKGLGYGVDAYKETLVGGNMRAGYRYFLHNLTGQCVRCHAFEGQGGQVGPALDGIADRLTREQLLESLIEPTARLAPGYGNVTLTLKDGQVVTGLLDSSYLRCRTFRSE